MVALHRQRSPAGDLDRLASAIEAIDPDVGGRAAQRLSAVRDRLLRTIRSYLIPRATHPGSPLTVVFAGPTGSGKSTLINSLVEMEVSATGPLRPTTKAPVAVASEPAAPDLGVISGIECAVVACSAPIVSRMSLVDTPDIDSTSTRNRFVSEILIDNADIVVFVTSALRYADLVPWEVLRRAKSRGAPVINVLNRVTGASSGAAVDFRSRLRAENLESEVIRVPEHHIPGGSHRLPSLTVRSLERKLTEMAAEMEDAAAAAFNSVLDSTVGEVLELADEIEAITRDGEERSEQLRSRLRDAAHRLDLTQLGQGLGPGEPPQSKLGRFRWKMRNRVGDAEWARVDGVLRRRLAALMEEDIGRIALESGVTGRLDDELIEDLRRMASGAASAWARELARLAGSPASPSGRLTAVALAEAAALGAATRALDELAEDAAVLARARRGLISRLEVIYGQSAARLTPDFEPQGPADVGRLRQVAAEVRARSLLADA